MKKSHVLTLLVVLVAAVALVTWGQVLLLMFPDLGFGRIAARATPVSSPAAIAVPPPSPTLTQPVAHPITRVSYGRTSYADRRASRGDPYGFRRGLGSGEDARDRSHSAFCFVGTSAAVAPHRLRRASALAEEARIAPWSLLLEWRITREEVPVGLIVLVRTAP